MTRFAGVALLVIGIVLVVWGANASQSFSSDMSTFFTGAVTNKAMVMIVGGALAVVAGASVAFSQRGKRV